MRTNHNNKLDSFIYKGNDKKTGNRQLDQGLAELKQNSIPFWVKNFAQGVRL